MLPALTAASSALGLLNSLTSSSASKSSGTNSPFALASTGSGNTTTTSSGSGTGQSPLLSSATMSSLFELQSESGSSTSSTDKKNDLLEQLFKLLDGDGDGSITKSEFEDKLGAGGTNTANADKVFDKLDKDGDGSLSESELSAVTKGRNATASYDRIDQMIQRQAEAIQASAASTLSVSA